jgi:NAD(P)-dependent dehydrogenase (short-subunit alcohol dehydrogenase family)
VLFAREGADVGLVHLPEEQRDANETCEVIRGCGRRVIAISGDVSSAEFCEEAVARCVEVLGCLNILVNNAAIQKHRCDVEALGIEDWNRTFAVNIHGYFYMTKAALKVMRHGSSILNTGSITGLEGNPELVDYASTKGAIHAFTKSMAQALLKWGIRVNCVAPGPVWTPLNAAERAPAVLRHFGADTPFGRPAQPEEIAPTYVYLASNADSSYVTGQVITPLGCRAGAE